MKKDILLFGGSFNPPHLAHKKIAKMLSQEYELIIYPCGTRSDKPSANIIPVDNRMEMVMIAFNDIAHDIDFYDWENNIYTATYFIQERYERLYPGRKIWHLIGEDLIAGGRDGKSEIQKSWTFGEKIWNELNFLVIVRPGYNANSKDLPPRSKVFEIKNIIGSGTLVRKRISQSKPVNDLVEPAIEKYINENYLYRSDVMSKQKELLDEFIEKFKEYKNKISQYKYPEELFGELKGSEDEKLKSLKKEFRKLIFEYGEDRYSHFRSEVLSDILDDIMNKIITLENEAINAIKNGTYGSMTSASEFSVDSGKHVYTIKNLESQADFSLVYSASFMNNQSPKEVCIKVARIADDDNVLLGDDEIVLNNDTILHEIDVLKKLDSIKDKTFQKVRKQHFPTLIDDFTFPSGYEGVDMDRHAFVTECVRAYDFVTLREKFPDGIPLYHACWMLARILSAVGHLHYNKMLHGGIKPESIFVNPQDHNVTLADLEFSISYDNKNSKYIGLTEYSAPEIKNGTEPHPRTDLYSIGKSMIYVLGGDIEKNTLPSFNIMNQNEGIEAIRSLVLSMANKHPLARSDDAWKAYHQLMELRKRAFGKPKFVGFKIQE